MSSADEKHLEHLARSLGLQLPPFRGPLEAFEFGGVRGADDPIYLGGDLHAVHPDTVDPRPAEERDHSLDSATVILDDLEHAATEFVAVEGVWCLALRGDLLVSAPYFTLWDTDGRIRAWLVLPPPQQMVGIGHLWLPSVPPPPGPRPRADQPG